MPNRHRQRRAQPAGRGRGGNKAKGDGDAATWLPPDTGYRCTYVARQVEVKAAYGRWVTPAEYDAINTVLKGCDGGRT